MDELATTIRAYDLNVEDYVNRLEFPLPLINLIDFSGLLSGKTILDAGCGAGRDSKYLFDNGFEVTGVDLSEEMLVAAKKISKARFLLRDIRDTGFSKGFFDGIWCYNALLHLNEKSLKDAVKEFCRVLKAGGILFVNTKQSNNELIEKTYRHEKHYFLYPENYLVDVFHKRGFFVLFSKKYSIKDEQFISLMMRKNSILASPENIK